MKFAVLDSDLSYWQKQTKPLFSDLAWNIPTQKTGHALIVGGNSQGFSTVIRTSEFIAKHCPFAHVTTLLPDALRGKLPPFSNVELLPSTTSGSFAKSLQLENYFMHSDATLVIGDLSKNSATADAIANAVLSAYHPDEPATNPPNSAPIVITRDAVDLLMNEMSRTLTRPNTFLVASMLQLQKLFRTIYYPRMIMLSQPLLPAIETLHKFTLTYPVTLLTFHQDNLIVSHDGHVSTTPIANTDYSPISLWSGPLAARVLAMNTFNPHKPFEATTAALLYAS